MSSSSDPTKKLVTESLNSIKHVFGDDTENSLVKIDSIRQIHTTNTLQYIKKEEEMKNLSAKLDRVSNTSECFLFESMESLINSPQMNQ